MFKLVNIENGKSHAEIQWGYPVPEQELSFGQAVYLSGNSWVDVSNGTKPTHIVCSDPNQSRVAAYRIYPTMRFRVPFSGTASGVFAGTAAKVTADGLSIEKATETDQTMVILDTCAASQSGDLMLAAFI